MSLSTDMALADAWLNADVALTKRTRRKELNEATDTYNDAITAMIDAQNAADDDQDLWEAVGYTIATIGSIWASGGLVNPITNPMQALQVYGTAAGAGSIGGNIAGGLYGELHDASQEMLSAKKDLEQLEVAFSDQSLKYDSEGAKAEASILEAKGDSKASDFDIWAENFYSGVDDFMQAGKSAILLGSNEMVGELYENPNAFINRS